MHLPRDTVMGMARFKFKGPKAPTGPRSNKLSDQAQDLANQAQDFAEQALDYAGGAVEGVSDAVEGLAKTVTEAATSTADLYRETVDDIRESMPTFKEIVAQAARMPGVTVSRSSYLTTVVGAKYKGEKLRLAIEATPARAGIELSKIDRMARKSIAKESRRTTLISAAVGIPGGAAAAATVPADLVQFWMHILRMLQKLSYLYGWRDLVYLDGNEPDEPKRAALVLFLAMMAGIPEADHALRKLAVLRVAGASEQNLRDALMHEPYTSIVKSSATALSQRTAARLTGQVAGKAMPIAGAIISSRITNASFNDMANRLHKQLKSYG